MVQYKSNLKTFELTEVITYIDTFSAKKGKYVQMKLNKIWWISYEIPSLSVFDIKYDAKVGIEDITDQFEIFFSVLVCVVSNSCAPVFRKM